MYFNASRKRTGALFQGRFRAEHAAYDTYLKYLFSYIHLNPVKLIDPKWKKNGIGDKRNAVNYLASYPYSSYMDYIDVKREYSKILSKKEFPAYFSTKMSFERHIDDWLSYRDVR